MTGDLFYIYAWVFSIATNIIISLIYPNFIAPCFNKFKELEDPELIKLIQDICRELNYPLNKIYVKDGSIR